MTTKATKKRSRTLPKKPRAATREISRKQMLCFVIMPFGKKGTDKEKHYWTVYEHIIRRAVEDTGFACLRADEIPDSGPVPETVKQQLRSADLVLADLSDRNPNVFYELGFRHALNLPSITISDDVSAIPFNLATYSTIQYTTANVADADKARDKIQEYAEKIKTNIGKQVALGRQKPPTPVELFLDIGSQVEQGFSNLYDLIGQHFPSSGPNSLKKEILAQSNRLNDIHSKLVDVKSTADAMRTASRLMQQTTDLGLVSIYPTRMDALEDQFFLTLEREERGIDIVGSTLFGLKGHHQDDRNKILDLLKGKFQREDFVLRILMTHWDYISHRQDQEKTQKNITRYVISKELKEAVYLLKSNGLADSKSVRFYRAAPTCFTVICRGQGLMLLNPYPYQIEAYNSWTAIFQRTRLRGVFDTFSEAHFDEPWENDTLTVPFDEECVTAVEEKLKHDLHLAQAEIAAEVTREK